VHWGVPLQRRPQGPPGVVGHEEHKLERVRPPAFAAHIHVGTVTEAGPVIVSLVPPTPTEGSSSGCTSADPVLIKAIMKNPEQYYVNVHTRTTLPALCAGSSRSSRDTSMTSAGREIATPGGVVPVARAAKAANRGTAGVERPAEAAVG
jgi:CHRD domain